MNSLSHLKRPLIECRFMGTFGHFDETELMKLSSIILTQFVLMPATNVTFTSNFSPETVNACTSEPGEFSIEQKIK